MKKKAKPTGNERESEEEEGGGEGFLSGNPFFGREKELDALLSCFTSLRSDRSDGVESSSPSCHAVLLQGPSVGKSTLVLKALDVFLSSNSLVSGVEPSFLLAEGSAALVIKFGVIQQLMIQIFRRNDRKKDTATLTCSADDASHTSSGRNNKQAKTAGVFMSRFKRAALGKTVVVL